MMLEIQLRNEMAKIQRQTEIMEIAHQREMSHRLPYHHWKSMTMMRVKDERQLMAAMIAAADESLDSKFGWGPTPRTAAAETPVVTTSIPKASTSKNMTAVMTPTWLRSPDPHGYYLSRTNE